MIRKSKIRGYWWGVGGLGLVLGAAFFLPRFWPAMSYSAIDLALQATSTPPAAPVPPQVPHLATPPAVKALYLTQCAASSPSFRDHVLGLAATTEVNAVVVDIKDYTGTVAFPSATAVPGGSGCTVGDFAALVKQMHEAGIYVIGRLTVFQDPLYTKTYPAQAVQSASTGAPWRDRKGLSFVDVGSKPFWDYIAALAMEAYELGVDEVNFDYVRYPSDGNMADARYQNLGASHAENLEQFFRYLDAKLKAESPQLVLSADLFGMTTTNYDDLNIGQVLERALPYFDYIGPMVYPSHYPAQFNGWPNPNVRPYDIVHFSLAKAVARTVATTTSIGALAYERIGTSTPAVYRKPSYDKNKIRPWLQDFDYPVPYTAEMVRAQIQATYDVGLNSWMMWDPRNEYTRPAYQ